MGLMESMIFIIGIMFFILDEVFKQNMRCMWFLSDVHMLPNRTKSTAAISMLSKTLNKIEGYV